MIVPRAAGPVIVYTEAMLITDRDQLADFCAQMRGAPYVAVDTEFLRERTFWPKLCLLQIASEDRAAAVDPLADGMELAPVLELNSWVDPSQN